MHVCKASTTVRQGGDKKSTWKLAGQLEHIAETARVFINKMKARTEAGRLSYDLHTFTLASALMHTQS